MTIEETLIPIIFAEVPETPRPGTWPEQPDEDNDARDDTSDLFGDEGGDEDDANEDTGGFQFPNPKDDEEPD